MKQTIAMIMALALVLAACGTSSDTDTDSQQEGTDTTAAQPSAPSGSVVFFGYEDSFLPEVLDPFVESTGIDVKTPAFGDEDETEAKLRAGFHADVVEMCSGEAGSLIEAGLVQPIDTGRIDKWDAIFDSFKEGEDVVDEDANVWIVPLQGGPFGIVYLEDETGPITSYDQLFFGDVGGDIAVSEEPISTIWDVAMALGYGPGIDEITDEQAIEAVDALVDMDRIRTTWSEDGDLIQLFATGEIIAASHATPDIAADAQNLDAAYALTNHYVDAEMQLIFAEEYGYMASNSEILDIADEGLIHDLGLDDPGSIDLVTIPEGLPDNGDLWDEEWQRFAG